MGPLNRLLEDLGPVYAALSEYTEATMEAADAAKEVFRPALDSWEKTKSTLGPTLGALVTALGTVAVAALCMIGILLFLLVIYWIGRHCFNARPTREQAYVRHILVKDEQHALFIKTELSRVKPSALLDRFHRFAVKHSDCWSGAVGGALGAIERGKMAPAFDSVVWASPLMTLQGPVLTDDGYHLILVVQRSSPSQSGKAVKVKAS